MCTSHFEHLRGCVNYELVLIQTEFLRGYFPKASQGSFGAGITMVDQARSLNILLLRGKIAAPETKLGPSRRFFQSTRRGVRNSILSYVFRPRGTSSFVPE